MTVSQVSIFVENTQGTLAVLAEVLAEAGIDIRAMTIADTTDFGILRLIVKDPERAKEVLQAKNFVVCVNQVLAVEVPDEVGGLAAVLRVLASAKVNVEYMYDLLAANKKKAYLITRVENNQKTAELLEENGLRTVDGKELGL